MGITHGNRLRTYKRECPRAFSLTLLVTLVMQPALARTNMLSHAAQILALQCVWGGCVTLYMHTRACVNGSF